MADSVANVLMNYSRTMPNPAGELAKGFSRGTARRTNKERNKLEERRTKIAEERNEREIAAGKRAEELAEHKELAGVAYSADTPTKWASAQELGFLPKDMKFEAREPYIMGVMTMNERLNREKMDFTKKQAGVTNKLAARKQAEVERSNLATENIARTKATKTARGKGGSGGRRLAVGDENYFAKRTGQLLDGTYDTATDTYQYKDSAARRKAVKINRDAARLASNSDMELSQAFYVAAERNGIDPSQVKDMVEEQPETQSTLIPARPTRDYSTLY